MTQEQENEMRIQNLLKSIISLNHCIITNNLPQAKNEIEFLSSQNYEGRLWEELIDFFYLYDNYKNETFDYVLRNLDIPSAHLHYIRFAYYSEKVANEPIMIEAKVRDMIEHPDIYFNNFPLLNKTYYFALIQYLIILYHFDNLETLLLEKMTQKEEEN